jgi:protein-disulfide isomerase
MEEKLNKLKTVGKFFGVATLALSLVNCAPSAKQLKEAIEKDPSIVFVAIEKDPEKFFEVANKAAQEAQKKAQEKQSDDEGKKRDDEFANPLKPEIEEGRVIFGNKNAPITIVEFSDFECPYCSRGHKTIEEVRKEYGDKVRIVFKHLPLEFHPQALPAARYFEAIARQDHGKAEKFHNMMFDNQKEMASKGEAYMKDAAKKLGMDMKKLEADLKDASLMKRIDADRAEAEKFGFSGTPGFLINGVSLRGAYPFPEFKKIIDRHLAAVK